MTRDMPPNPPCALSPFTVTLCSPVPGCVNSSTCTETSPTVSSTPEPGRTDRGLGELSSLPPPPPVLAESGPHTHRALAQGEPEALPGPWAQLSTSLILAPCTAPLFSSHYSGVQSTGQPQLGLQLRGHLFSPCLSFLSGYHSHSWVLFPYISSTPSPSSFQNPKLFD